MRDKEEFLLVDYPSRRSGHKCIIAEIFLDVFRKKENELPYRSFKFIFDTGADVCLMPLVMAQQYGIHVEEVEENRLNPPNTRAGRLTGYWGTITISLLGLRPELTCFF